MPHLKKHLNVPLWIIQILLALWNLIGGVYVISNFKFLANAWAAALPAACWFVLGGLQILFALGIVLPGMLKMRNLYITISAAGLAIISLLGIEVYTAYAGFPGMLWGLIPAILAAFVGYRRH